MDGIQKISGRNNYDGFGGNAESTGLMLKRDNAGLHPPFWLNRIEISATNMKNPFFGSLISQVCASRPTDIYLAWPLLSGRPQQYLQDF